MKGGKAQRGKLVKRRGKVRNFGKSSEVRKKCKKSVGNKGKKVPIFVNKEISNKKHKERKKVNKKEKE